MNTLIYSNITSMPRKKNRSKARVDEVKRILCDEIKMRNAEIEEKNQKIANLKIELEQYKRRWEGLNNFIRTSSDYKMRPQVDWLKEEYWKIAANNRALGTVIDGCYHCDNMRKSMRIPRLEFPID